MIGQISTVYFQSYQLAYDLAKKAEQCYQYELGEFGNSNFIQFGYWDSLKKGLLSAEKLQYDLRRMESSYYDKNKRELELTKHISLMLLNPQAILDLRKNGTCNIIIPEAAYDLDFQGHYFRRIKAVSVSIPCIAGPYTSVNATLRLLKHTTRLNTQLLAGAYESSDYSNDLRFRHVTNETHSIATSSAQNDSGMFEFNFRDERFLPFEGCGAFGEWQLELNADETLRMFDYNTISDIIITVRYTAKEDAGPFKTEATTNLKNIIESAIIPTNNSGGLQLSRLFSLKQEYANDWNKFLNPIVAGSDQILSITIQKQHFPYFIKDRKIKIKQIEVVVKANRTGNYEMIFEGTNLDGDLIQSATQTLSEGPVYSGMHSALLDAGTESANMETVDILKPISLKFKHESDGDYHSIDRVAEEIGEVYLVVGYEVGV